MSELGLEMNPHIEETTFGMIRVSGKIYEHDIVIRLNGMVEKRRKKLSKALYGTSHIISLEEAQQVYEEGARELILGGGQFCKVTLSEEAADFFKHKKVCITLLSTPDAINAWNDAEGPAIGLFHVTC